VSKLQEKTSALKREHPALRKMKIINFFLCLWVIFALLDPVLDPDCKSGYGSRDPIESGSNPDTDPDPHHWPLMDIISCEAVPIGSLSQNACEE
jgi:hypothetical protein